MHIYTYYIYICVGVCVQVLIYSVIFQNQSVSTTQDCEGINRCQCLTINHTVYFSKTATQ